MTNKIIYKFTLLIMVALFLENCGAVKPKVPASALTKREANKISAVNDDSKKSNETQYVLKIETTVETDGVTYVQTVKAKSGETSANKKNSFVQNSNNEKVNIKANKKDISVNSSLGNSYSNFIRVKTVYELFCEPTGNFPHNPEPLPENLVEISKTVVDKKADLGIVVDPDVDRLALVCEDGTMFGEEYTLVAVSDYVLSKSTGNTVSNLSSTRALRDITDKYKGQYEASAVGEVNVVEKMKEINAIIGGEGNGGVIYPKLHYGRDALVAIALFLTQLAERKLSVKKLRDTYPNYFIVKHKIQLSSKIEVHSILSVLAEKYNNEKLTTIDGLKIDFADGWVHLRRSNTEPIIRIYAESEQKDKADAFAENMINDIKELI